MQPGDAQMSKSPDKSPQNSVPHHIDAAGDQPNPGRRRLLAFLGLAAVAVYAAPMVVQIGDEAQAGSRSDGRRRRRGGSRSDGRRRHQSRGRNSQNSDMRRRRRTSSRPSNNQRSRSSDNRRRQQQGTWRQL